MIPNQGLSTATNIKLPISFIVYALLAFVTSQFILVLNSSEMLDGYFRLPDIWMGAHFLLLGFAVMVAMGAMYQLVPVAFLTSIWNEKFGFIQFGITAFGVALFAILLSVSPTKAIYAGIVVVIGIILFIIQMLLTIWKQKKKSIMTYIIITAILCLALTIGLGFLLAWNIAYGGIANHTSLLFAHMLLGIAGWFTLLIFGFSYKLVPMFSLSHGFSMKWSKPMFITYTTGLALLLLSFLFQLSVLTTISWLLLLLGFTFFILDMKEILTKRVKKRLDKPFTFSLLAIANGYIIHFIALIASLFGLNHTVFWGWVIYIYVFSWIIFSILGYLYKIVPFLWWTHRYADRVGKEKVPTLKEMINERASQFILLLFYISMIGLIVCICFQFGIGVFIFQALLCMTACIYSFSIFRVLFI